MKTIQIKGIIQYDDWEKRRIYLIDGDEKLDLVEEFEDAMQENGHMAQVNYWVSPEPCTKNEMLEHHLSQIAGAIEAEYESHYLGSWTYGCGSYDQSESRGVLKIGGHDLFDELSDSNGEFVIIEINFLEP